jgi:hypothetical protein
MPLKKQTFVLIPIPKKNPLFQSLKKKPPLERGGITPSSPLHPKKNRFEKDLKKKTPFPLFLKLHLQLVILSI